VLSRRTGYATCQFPALSANRFERELIDYVGTLVQSTILSIEVAGARFDELVRRAFSAVITANRIGAYDVYQQIDAVRGALHDRGLFGNFEPMLNNLAFTGAARSAPASLDEVSAALRETTLTWQPTPATTALIRFDIDWGNNQLNCRIWSGDTGRVSRDEMTELLYGLERLLVAAAATNLDAADIGPATGLELIARPAGWLFVDGCWVELSEVQRLVDEALAPARGRVFADVDGRPLVAYLAGAAGTVTQAHERCLAALPGRHTAMTPRWYVFCEQAPTDLSTVDAWRRQRVLAAGSGRS
jgi:hypothetical protein